MKEPTQAKDHMNAQFVAKISFVLLIYYATKKHILNKGCKVSESRKLKTMFLERIGFEMISLGYGPLD